MKIQIRTNSLFKKYLIRKRKTSSEHDVNIKTQIIEVNEFLFLKSNYVRNKKPVYDKTTFYDETAFECFVNKIDVDSITNKANGQEVYFVTGMSIISKLLSSTIKANISSEVVITFSFNKTSASIWVYKLRHNQHFLKKDLNSYNDYIMELKVDTGSL
jgi:hypothetical protein